MNYIKCTINKMILTENQRNAIFIILSIVGGISIGFIAYLIVRHFKKNNTKCIPICTNKQCGETDNCGGTCDGTCSDTTFTCVNKACVKKTQPDDNDCYKDGESPFDGNDDCSKGFKCCGESVFCTNGATPPRYSCSSNCSEENKVLSTSTFIPVCNNHKNCKNNSKIFCKQS